MRKVLILIALYASGCMQIIGADKVDMWGFTIEASGGQEFSIGHQRYNTADNRKGLNNTDGRKY